MTLSLDQTVRDAVSEAVIARPDVKVPLDQLSVSVAMKTSSESPWQTGQYRGAEPYYPASVVKLFWLTYMAHCLDEGKITLTPEASRAATDMIRESNNDATGYVVNLTTGGLPGPELTGKAYKEWVNNRQAANRWFAAQGYEKLNVLNRTYNEGPYGVEQQIIGPNYENRNRLTADATSRLFTEIADGKQPRSPWMLDLLRRSDPKDGQRVEFLGESVPDEWTFYSKAGWTSTTRHDTCYLVTPSGSHVVISVYTTFPNDTKLIPIIGSKVLKKLGFEPKGFGSGKND